MVEKSSKRGSHNRGKRAKEKSERCNKTSEPKVQNSLQKETTNGRKKEKYSALKVRLNLKSRMDEISDLASYVDQLNESEKEWLNTFAEEYVNANFNHGKERIHPVEYKEFERKNGSKYKADKYKKACEDNNNSRNRCVYTKASTTGNLQAYEDLSDLENVLKKNKKS